MKTLLIIIGLLVGGNVFGQNKENLIHYSGIFQPLKERNVNYIIGCKNLNTLELGIALGARHLSEYNLFYSNYHLSPEITFTPDNPILGTKVGFTNNLIFLNVGTQFIHYTDFQNQNFAIRPEIGLTLLGLTDLVYGYNFIINKSKIENLTNHCISLRLTFGSENSKLIKQLL